MKSRVYWTNSVSHSDVNASGSFLSIACNLWSKLAQALSRFTSSGALANLHSVYDGLRVIELSMNILLASVIASLCSVAFKASTHIHEYIVSRAARASHQLFENSCIRVSKSASRFHEYLIHSSICIAVIPLITSVSPLSGIASIHAIKEFTISLYSASVRWVIFHKSVYDGGTYQTVWILGTSSACDCWGDIESVQAIAAAESSLIVLAKISHLPLPDITSHSCHASFGPFGVMFSK